MMILVSKNKSTAIDWPSIESFTFENGEHNKELVINTKSGATCKLLNPSDETETELNFEAVVNAWLSGYTAWRIFEGENKTPAPTGMPLQMPPPLLNCERCGQELEFGNCTNYLCIND